MPDDYPDNSESDQNAENEMNEIPFEDRYASIPIAEPVNRDDESGDNAAAGRVIIGDQTLRPDLALAIGVEEKEDDSSCFDRTQIPKKYWISMCIALIVTVGASAYLVSINSRGSSSRTNIGQGIPTVTPRPPTYMPSTIPSIPPTAFASLAPTTTKEAFVIRTVSLFADKNAVRKPKTPQGQALAWMVDPNGPNYSVVDPLKIRQRYALLTLHFALGGQNWKEKDLFLSDSDECEWNIFVNSDEGLRKWGVSHCNDGYVTGINLSKFNLEGTLPQEIGGLSKLESLVLKENSIAGNLPKSLSHLTNLVSLDASSNKISGSIPKEIGSCEDMESLILEHNQLSGEMPAELNSLTKLKVLYLGHNSLRGRVPKEYSSLTELQKLELHRNDIIGDMDVFCADFANTITKFQTDCLDTAFPVIESKVTCDCCSVCCNETNDCIPNNV